MSCSYLSACITETMRVCPPVPGIPWRETESEGIVINGNYVPPKCNVGTWVLINRDPSPSFHHPRLLIASSSSSSKAQSTRSTTTPPFSTTPHFPSLSLDPNRPRLPHTDRSRIHRLQPLFSRPPRMRRPIDSDFGNEHHGRTCHFHLWFPRRTGRARDGWGRRWFEG